MAQGIWALILFTIFSIWWWTTGLESSIRPSSGWLVPIDPISDPPEPFVAWLAWLAIYVGPPLLFAIIWQAIDRRRRLG